MLGRCRTSLRPWPALEEAGQELHSSIDSKNPRAFLRSGNEKRLGLTARINQITASYVWITWGSDSPTRKNAPISPR